MKQILAREKCSEHDQLCQKAVTQDHQSVVVITNMGILSKVNFDDDLSCVKIITLLQIIALHLQLRKNLSFSCNAEMCQLV